MRCDTTWRRWQAAAPSWWSTSVWRSSETYAGARGHDHELCGRKDAVGRLGYLQKSSSSTANRHGYNFEVPARRKGQRSRSRSSRRVASSMRLLRGMTEPSARPRIKEIPPFAAISRTRNRPSRRPRREHRPAAGGWSSGPARQTRARMAGRLELPGEVVTSTSRIEAPTRSPSPGPGERGSHLRSRGGHLEGQREDAALLTARREAGQARSDMGVPAEGEDLASSSESKSEERRRAPTTRPLHLLPATSFCARTNAAQFVRGLTKDGRIFDFEEANALDNEFCGHASRPTGGPFSSTSKVGDGAAATRPGGPARSGAWR